MKIIKSKHFTNGSVYCVKLNDGFLIETTDTFLPAYTKNASFSKNNMLNSQDVDSRGDRWMIGVSVSSGCPVGCKFCATGKMKRYRNLTASEIVDQVDFIIGMNSEYDPARSIEFKINYTRMGDTFLNVNAVREAILIINSKYPNVHHFISTIGISGSDFSWVHGNITLQFSVHSFDEDRRNWLIPFFNKMTLRQLGLVRTSSNLKTTINLTLVDESDFDIDMVKEYFDKDFFFIKLSPINNNDFSESNGITNGVIKTINLL